MTSVAFDTLKFVRALRDKAKLSPEQAEGFADAIAEALQGDLATKNDLAAVRGDFAAVHADLHTQIAGVRADLQTQIAGVRADVQTQIAEAKTEIIKWMFGTIGFQTLIIIGAVIALVRAIKP